MVIHFRLAILRENHYAILVQCLEFPASPTCKRAYRFLNSKIPCEPMACNCKVTQNIQDETDSLWKFSSFRIKTHLSTSLLQPTCSTSPFSASQAGVFRRSGPAAAPQLSPGNPENSRNAPPEFSYLSIYYYLCN